MCKKPTTGTGPLLLTHDNNRKADFRSRARRVRLRRVKPDSVPREPGLATCPEVSGLFSQETAYTFWIGQRFGGEVLWRHVPFAEYGLLWARLTVVAPGTLLVDPVGGIREAPTDMRLPVEGTIRAFEARGTFLGRALPFWSEYREDRKILFVRFPQAEEWNECLTSAIRAAGYTISWE